MNDNSINIEKMIGEMNNHMAVSRRSLLDYLESGDSTFKTRSGDICSIPSEELEYLSSICTEIEKMRLKLPIFISTDISYEGGAWKVDGITETSVVSRILGKSPHREDMLRFYYPDMQKVRKLIPNAIEILFMP